MRAMTAPPDIREKEDRLQQLRGEKQAAIAMQDFEKAARIRDSEQEIILEIAESEKDWKVPHPSHQMQVTERRDNRDTLLVDGHPGLPAHRGGDREAPSHGG